MSELWYQKACVKMVRESKSLYSVSNELDMGLTVKECEELGKDLEFSKVLRGERFKYYKEIATDPNRSKISTVGNMMFLAEELTKSGAYDKAAKVYMDICKIEGWADATTNVNIFGDLSQKDLDSMKAKVKAAARDAVN